MLLYTSSAGRSGMQVFARVKNAIFSLKPHTANSDIIIVRDEVATFKLPHEWICGGDGAFRTWRSAPRGPLCGSGLWSCGRPWLRPSSFSPPSSPAAAPLESEENKSSEFLLQRDNYTVTVKKERKRPLEDYLFHLHIESKRGHRHWFHHVTRGQRLHGRPGHSAVSSPVSRPAWGAAGSVRLLGPRRAALSGPAASPSPAASSAPAAPAAPAPAEPAASGTPAGPAPGPERSAAARPDL